MAYIYILTNTHNTVLYIGSTSDLVKRLYMHKRGLIKGFTQRYNVTKLVHFEKFESIELARQREIQLKKTLRARKIALINTSNPEWRELACDAGAV